MALAWRALTSINVGNRLAYTAGDIVPDANVALYHYDAQGLVERVNLPGSLPRPDGIDLVTQAEFDAGIQERAAALGFAKAADIAAAVANRATKDELAAAVAGASISATDAVARKDAADAKTAAGNAVATAGTAYSTATAASATAAPLLNVAKSKVALGEKALNSLPPNYSLGSTGSLIALGYGALGSATAVKTSIAIGSQALGNTIIGRENIAIGSASLINAQSDSADYNQTAEAGTRNIAIGGNAGYFAKRTTGLNAMGRNAASGIVAGTGLTAIGHNAVGGAAPIGLSGVIENYAPWGYEGQTVRTTAVGNSAAQRASAANIVAVGGEALAVNKKSDNNVAVGARALTNIDSGTGYSGGTYTTTNLPGTYSWAGTTLTITATGPHGFVVGDYVFLQLLDGPGATFNNDVARALVATTPDTVTLTITQALAGQPIKDVTGTGTAVILGKETAAQAALNPDNTAVGTSAGASLVTGNANTLGGSGALGAATTASQSTVFGKSALASASSATNCAAFGFDAALNMTGAASQVTALGASALRFKVDATNLTDATYTNITGVGYDTRVSGANQVQLGNSSATVYAQSAIQTRSDARDKADVRDTELGLDFIEQLRPVDYRWDRREDYTPLDPETGEIVHLERDGSQKGTRYHHGLIAQEVAEVIAETGVDFGGFQDHTVAGGSDVLSIGYEELIAPLIKAVQELSAEVKALKAAAGA